VEIEEEIEPGLEPFQEKGSEYMPAFHQFANMPGVELAQEETRRYIAYWALGGYVGLLGFIVLAGWIVLRLPIDDVLKILTTLAGVLSGVVGAIVGFYFRSKG
jgi:hypothetical protein